PRNAAWSAPICTASSSSSACRPGARAAKADADASCRSAPIREARAYNARSSERGAAHVKIIILGAGQVGTSVAENLVSEANDITLVDSNAELLEQLRERFEARTVCGNGASPTTLREAGADDADLLIAV